MKNLKKALVLLLVASMCAGTMNLPVFADGTPTPGTEVVDNGDGTTSTIVTDVTTTTEDGKTTVTVTIDKTTEGTTTDGVKVDGKENTTITTESDENGTVEKTINNGSEKKEWDEDIKPGQEVPSVKVDLESGKTVTVEFEDSSSVITGDQPEDENDSSYDYTTTTTTTNRDVNGTLDVEEEFVIKSDESKLECPRGPEDYAGKNYFTGSDDACDPADPNKRYDTHYREGVLRADEDKYQYQVDENGNIMLDEDGNPLPLYDKNGNIYVGAKPDTSGYEKGYDFVWSGSGEGSCSTIPVFIKEIVYLPEYVKDENGDYVLDEDGNKIIALDEEGNEIPALDEDGNKIIDMVRSTFMSAGSDATTKMKNDEALPEIVREKGATGMIATPGQFVLKHENGKYFYAYCMDAATGASPTFNRWYNIRNLEDAIYSDENPDGYLTKDEAAMIRAIVTNGYWGNESGKGSLESLKELLKAHYNEDSVITVRYPGDNEGYTGKIFDLIDGLTEAEALSVTQAAIWAYANSDDFGGVPGAGIAAVLSASQYHNSGPRFISAFRPAKDYDSDIRMQALLKVLLNLDPIYSDGELREDSAVIPNAGVIREVALVIKDKVADETIVANYDDNDDNDVYNTDLNFQLAFIPGEKDQMYVCLLNGDNVIVDKKLLVSEDSTIEGDHVLKPVNGVYTLTGLKLSENSEFEFDLRLEGTQYLNEGVYIYQAEGGRRESQTLVGLAKGEQKVEVSTKLTLNFEVDESNHVVAEREWYFESDPIVTPPEEETEPEETEPEETEPEETEPEETEPEETEPEETKPEETEPEETEAPETEPEEDIVIINDEDIPLTDIPDEPVPQTGDSAMWYICSVFAAIGLFVLSLFDKKQKFNA